MMAKKSVMTYLLAVLAVLLVGCQAAYEETVQHTCEDALGCVVVPAGDSIKLGILQVISGDASPLGITQEQATRLAISDYGDVHGHTVTAQTEDTRCSSEGGANAALRIVADPQMVGVLGTTCSGAAVGIMPILSEAGLVMISGLNTAPSLTSIHGVAGENWYPGYYRVIANGVEMASAGAVFTYEQLGITKVATVNDGDAFTVGLAQAFDTTFSEIGGDVALSATINKGDQNMRPLLEAIEMSGAGMVFIPIFQPDGDRIVLQSDEFPTLADIQFMSMPSLTAEPFIQAVRDVVPGRMYFLATHNSDPQKLDELREAYTQVYDEPRHSGYGYAYDAANLLLSTIEDIASEDQDGNLYIGRQQLRDALYATENYPGVTGPLTCDDFGDCAFVATDVIHIASTDDTLERVLGNIIYTHEKTNTQP